MEYDAQTLCNIGQWCLQTKIYILLILKTSNGREKQILPFCDYIWLFVKNISNHLYLIRIDPFRNIQLKNKYARTLIRRYGETDHSREK